MVCLQVKISSIDVIVDRIFPNKMNRYDQLELLNNHIQKLQDEGKEVPTIFFMTQARLIKEIDRIEHLEGLRAELVRGVEEIDAHVQNLESDDVPNIFSLARSSAMKEIGEIDAELTSFD